MAYDPDGQIELGIENAAKQYSRPQECAEYDFTYGTAGFRMKQAYMDYVVLTVGMLSALRSRKRHSQAIGVMITASHNYAADNGVKIVDPQGEMLEQKWEEYATYWANARDPATTKYCYGHLVQKLDIPTSAPAKVIFARDTRPSGVRLIKALKAGLDALSAEYEDYGMLTTPQLHYLVKSINSGKAVFHKEPLFPYGEPTVKGYYERMADAYVKLMDGVKPIGSVSVDCANGVGAPKLKELIKYLPSGEGTLNIRIVNDNIDDADVLNHNCGADYVKSQQLTPAGFNGKAFDRWASLDGDADRIVYFFNEESSIFHILDGDRIATLAASFIGDLIKKAGLSEKLSIAVVQTAYANGASTKYIESHLKLKVECTNTGVKHLHHAAQRYDIGVYFEANGHGTVLFSNNSTKCLKHHEPESPAQLEALDTLRALHNLVNQTVGDALADLLLVEVVLAHKEFTVKEWLATYNDLPNKLGKVKVRDRASYITVEGSAERRLAEPSGLQATLDEITAKYKDGRCFVRASGTEDAVRVYGEAAEAYDCDDLVGKAMDAIAAKSSLGINH